MQEAPCRSVPLYQEFNRGNIASKTQPGPDSLKRSEVTRHVSFSFHEKMPAEDH